MALKENDFIEIEFTGKAQDGEVFDSNIKEELDKLGSKAPAKPFVFKLGKDMFLRGVDKFLIGKDVGEYDITLEPEEAFGKRDPSLMHIVPMKMFRDQNIRPFPGLSLNFDGRIGKILSVSGGRVRVDFNNPVAGKVVEYKIKVNRVVDDEKEQIKAIIDFLLRKEFDFEIKGDKVHVKVDKGLKRFLEFFKDQFKELSGKELVLEEIEEKKEAAKEEKKE